MSRSARRVHVLAVATALMLVGAGTVAGSAQARSASTVDAVQQASPQDVLDAVKRSSPNQVGLAWQYLRDIGQIPPTSPQAVLEIVKRTSPNQVGLAWQYLRDTGQIATAKAASASRRPDDRAGARGPGPAVASHGSNTAFDWSDWGIGAASGIGLTLLALTGIAFVVRRRPDGEAIGPAAGAAS